MISALIYLAAVLSANLTATLFLPIEVIPGTGVLVSCGTIIFGITFTQRDIMHRHGKAFVYKIIIFGALLNLAMLVSYRYTWGHFVVAYFDAREWSWLAESARMLQDSGWRVFIASFVAMLMAESADTEIFHYYRQKSWWGRVFRSNAVSIPVDSVVFNLIAFAGSPFFPVWVLVKVIFGEILAKYVVGALYALVRPGRFLVRGYHESSV